MARRRNNTAGVTLGFLGSGKVSPKNATALLDDYLETYGSADLFILPLTEEMWTASMTAVAEYAETNEIPIRLISNGDIEDDVLDVDPEEGSVRVKKAPERVIKDTAAAGEQGRLVFLWDDEDPNLEDLLDLTLDEGTVALDLTMGLQRLEFQEIDEPDEVAEPEAVVVQEPGPAPEPDDDVGDDTVEAEEVDGEEDDEPEPAAAAPGADADRDELITYAESLGIEVYKGMRTTTLVKAIEEAEAQAAQPEVEEDDVIDLTDEKVEDFTQSTSTGTWTEEAVLESVTTVDKYGAGSVSHTISGAHVTVNINVVLDGDNPEGVAKAARDLIASLR